MGADLFTGKMTSVRKLLLPCACWAVEVLWRKDSMLHSSLLLHFAKLPSGPARRTTNLSRSGSLQVLECSILDMMEVYDDLDRFIDDSRYDVPRRSF